MNGLRLDLADLLNRHSAENESDTPDFLLARFLERCLQAFDEAVSARSRWYRCGSDEVEANTESVA